MMKNLLTYIAWPALAGLSFAAALLLAPRLASHIPALAPASETVSTSQPTTVMPVISFSPAIKKAAPAVVSINSFNRGERTTIRRLSPNSPFRVPAEPLPYESNSLGSGVIIDGDGYIITSYHVFFGEDPNTNTYARVITVTLHDGREIEGNLVALDEKNDLALLKIDAGNLPYLRLSDSSKLEVGDLVLAIGTPRNIGQSVSSGIISALWRRDDSFIIQTDAAINPGNSGGALIDVNGDLIGINSSIVSESGGSEGISFAIAAGKATSLLNEYLSTSPSGYLGVDTNTLSLELGREHYDADVQGFVVSEVVPNGPADKAGIRQGDVITGIDNEKILISDPKNRTEANRAIAMISSLPAGKMVVLEVFREGNLLQLPTVLGVGRPNFSGIERIDEQSVDAAAPDTATTTQQ
ncbi:MAG: trypsin-like peptidase domain-containing protein [Pseudomonadota bacterium]